MNWHQQKSQNERRAPVFFHPDKWTHMEDLPHLTTSIMRFDTEELALEHQKKVGGYLLPPQK